MIQISMSLPTHNGYEMTNWEEIEFNTFKGGEPNPRLTDHQILGLTKATEVVLRAHMPSMDDVWVLLLATDAVRRIAPRMPIAVIIPYLPYGRQDRVCNPGEALGISVFAKVLNLQNYSEVVLVDPHSDASAAAINNSYVRTVEEYILHHNAFPNLKMSDTYLVAPDAGAQKKVKALVKTLGAKGYICATKERDLETMEITGTRFDANVEGKKLLVIDDICDGGRTFIALAKAIREHNPEELHLFVTHGIFSYGTEVVTEHFDSVCTTNSFQPTAMYQNDGTGHFDPKMTWLQV